MPVVPSHANLLQSHKEDLYQFLVACQQVSIEKNCPQIVSISLAIPPVDPLAVLDAISQPDQLHFYFENPGKGEAIAAIGSALDFTVQAGDERFASARDFIRSSLSNTITSALPHPFAGPHFFCSFTFFDEPQPENSPFPAATVFLPRWQVVRSQDSCVVVANLTLKSDDNLKGLSLSLWEIIQKILANKYLNIKCYAFSKETFRAEQITDINKLRTAVISALDSIQANHFSKIVLAHAINVISGRPFHLVERLDKLRRLHPDCYIFSTGNGKGTNFIGASPERLISIRDRQLATDALAGSAPRGKTPAEDARLGKALRGSEKEMHEHVVVIDFIAERLSQLGMTPQVSRRVRLLQLSNIQHLWTPIQAKVPPGVHPLEILAELHPTPAVAGAPRDIACQGIRRYEGFDRCLYAAPLGWVDHQGNAEFIVGIRSALIQGDRARLYAGAGIVAGSDPDKELAEIQLKLQALLKALV